MISLSRRDLYVSSYVYILRLIGPISYPGECDLMIHSWKYIVFSHEYILLPSYVYNMHQDTKSTWLIAVCKRSFSSNYWSSLFAKS